MSQTSTIVRVTGLTVLGGLLAYAIYFDYKRRNDISFRKKLRKDKKKVDKHVAQVKESAESLGVSAEELRTALEKVKKEELPQSSVDREQYFMSQVGMGEQLSIQGPAFHLPAALCFFRAMRVYPSPVELIMIYQKTVPEPIFKIVMEMTNMDVKERVEGYYNHFPPKHMNVKVEQVDVSDGKDGQIKKKILVADKDFSAGDVIYKENPVVAVLDLDLQNLGAYCSHCFRRIEPGQAIRPDSDRLDAAYCSEECQKLSKVQSENLLFSTDSVLPAEVAPDLGPLVKEQRGRAQQQYVEYIKKTDKVVPLLVARFIARQVSVETAKMLPKGSEGAKLATEAGADGEYTFYDHIERLRYLDVKVEDEEMALLRNVLKTALPGLEEFVTEERHGTLTGKMAYNAIGVCFDGGRDDKPPSTKRPEDIERTRSPHGTSRQIGCGYYAVSSYLSHSCDPSARPVFESGTTELSLVANRDIKKGEEITMAYVDVTQHPDETPVDVRRRRRVELARGWRFACGCDLCTNENLSTSLSSEEDLSIKKDESKVEEVVQRVESTTAE